MAANVTIDISLTQVHRRLSEGLEKLVAAASGYPVSMEADGSLWISVDWLREKLKEIE